MVDDATITVNSENSNYPKGKLQDYHLSAVYRSTQTSSDEWIKCEFDDSSSADAAAIVGHNFSSGSSITIEASSIDSFDTPSIQETLSYSTGAMWKTFTGGQYKYWRFHINDTGNTDSYIEVARPILVNKYELTNIFGNKFTHSYENTSRVKYSYTGQPFGVRGYEYRTLDLNFPYWTETDKANLRDMISECDIFTPLLVIPTSDDTSEIPPIYCNITEPLTVNHIIKWKYQGTLKLREVK